MKTIVLLLAFLCVHCGTTKKQANNLSHSKSGSAAPKISRLPPWMRDRDHFIAEYERALRSANNQVADLKRYAGSMAKSSRDQLSNLLNKTESTSKELKASLANVKMASQGAYGKAKEKARQAEKKLEASLQSLRSWK